MSSPENRDKTGRFVPGNSANPGGRPKGVAEFREWMSEDDPARKVARRYALRQRLYDLAFDDDRKTAAKAVELLLAYDMGRPPQRIEDESGNAIQAGVIFLPAKKADADAG